MNGISNGGTAVGFSTTDNAAFTNFTANPLTSLAANELNINGSTAAYLRHRARRTFRQIAPRPARG
jgi:hypothetical protein